MATETHGERLDRVVGLLAESHISLEKVVAELATETRRGFDQVAAQFEVIGRHMAKTDERFRETDDRVDKLVVAIGEFIRTQPG